MTRVVVIGAGAWGTALCTVVRRAGGEVRLWAHEKPVAETINARHENPDFLPGVALDPAITASSEPEVAADGDVLILAAPAQHLRAVTARIAGFARASAPAVICAKGVEQQSAALMSEVVAETLPGRPIAVLSGPTFAAEVAAGLPTAVTLACADVAAAEAIQTTLGSTNFRPYVTDDVIGAQIGGAVKNVLAIACGITEGCGFGENARAALITRGLVETTRLCVALGGRAETMMGLSGLGDLALTCTSTASRNYSLGVALGEGRSLAEIMGSRRSVAEGVFSASSVALLAERHSVEMPISLAVDGILNHGTGLAEAIEGLLARPFRAEATPRPPRTARASS